jgi:hypothetical protein
MSAEIGSHAWRAEMILEQLEEQWHVGEPHQRIMLACTHALLAIADRLQPAQLPGPDQRPTDGSERALCAECGDTIYKHANAPWLHVETGLVWCYRDQAHPEVARP